MKKSIYRWIWQVSGGEKLKILWLTLVQVALGGSAVLSAWLLRGLIDAAVAKTTGEFWLHAVLFASLTLGQITLRAVLRRLSESSRAGLENRFKGRLLSALLYANYADVSKTHSGEWMNRLTSDTVVLADGLSGILPDISGMAVKLIGALALLVAMMPELSMVILAGGVLLILLTLAFRKRLKQLHKRIQESDGRLREFLTERLTAAVVLRAFGSQETVLQGADEKMEDHRKARMKRNAFHNICNIGFGLAIQGGYVVGAVFCAYGILNGVITLGTFTAVLQLISQVQSPFANLSGFVPKFYAALASAERLREAEGYALDLSGKEISMSQSKALYEQLSAIELKGVTFTYPGDREATLQDFSMTVNKGEYVALTGHSGCGKSTSLKLLLSLYPCDSGTIALHGKDTFPLTAKHRRLFAYVPQENVLMRGTIRDVVNFGSPEQKLKDEQIWDALRVSCADSFVAELEDGLDTVLGERGLGLSEGQLQRLAVARAICSDRPVLLLDEATSALDEETEARLLANLRSMTDKTVIIVTHRPGALEICDKEVHFDK